MKIEPLHIITHSDILSEHLSQVNELCGGGAKWIQIRIKNYPDNECIPIIEESAKICKSTDTKLIVNDRVELVRKLGLDGVHLGKNDMAPKEARKVLGEKAIIGGTANSFEDIIRLSKQKVNYIGLGPYRFTTTKKNIAPTLGIEGYKALIEKMRQKKIYLPIIAIGGIKEEDTLNLMSAGLHGIAVSGEIINSKDKAKTIQSFNSFLAKNISDSEHGTS